MNRNGLLLIVILLASLAMVLAAYFMVEPQRQPEEKNASYEQPISAKSDSDQQRLPEPAPRPTALQTAPKSAAAKLTAQDRLALLAALLAKVQASSPTAVAGQAGAKKAPTAPANALGSLSREYIQKQIREITPLIKECYQLALARNPYLSAKLRVRFTIVGDAELGGVIEQSEIVEAQGERVDEELAMCVRETMYALRLDAPEGGGRVTVTYPFVFSTTARVDSEGNVR